MDCDCPRRVAGVIDDLDLPRLDDEEAEVAVADGDECLPVLIHPGRGGGAAAQLSNLCGGAGRQPGRGGGRRAPHAGPAPRGAATAPRPRLPPHPPAVSLTPPRGRGPVRPLRAVHDRYLDFAPRIVGVPFARLEGAPEAGP